MDGIGDIRQHEAVGTDPNEAGATATEYAVLLAFLVLLTITGISLYGQAVRGIIVGFTGEIASWVT